MRAMSQRRCRREAEASQPLAVVLIELEVPVQVVAPALRRTSQPNGDANRRRRHRPSRMPDQPHACFVGRASTLAAIAGDATGNDVLPVLAAALGHRYHVIECEFWCGEDFSAVLAFELVSGVD